MNKTPYPKCFGYVQFWAKDNFRDRDLRDPIPFTCVKIGGNIFGPENSNANGMNSGLASGTEKRG
ncbi:hypothetical protein [Flavihumibacter fluvii]|uniref:hypothetical protein n=1 Tax=Flavihumibacter fluvii TaxID=2838157 RepID=UPI001BDE51EC|nr:hypothetical protein [Flavihumibacter fluvii]ULQ53177.1 hypothetical protein KJS93_02445 [Flavihumibacter fluvii]